MIYIKNITIFILIFLPTIIFAQEMEHIIHYWDNQNKIKKEEGGLLDGKKNSLWTEWNQNGDLISKIEYINDKKNGKYLSYRYGITHNDYSFRDEGDMKEDKPVGVWMQYKSPAFKSKWKLYRKKEYIILNDNQLKYKEWDADGHQLVEEHYNTNMEFYNPGILNGLFISWYKNGQKKLEGNYVDGKQDGIWKKWYENGNKELEEKYLNGKLEGLRVKWYDNKNKELEEEYKNGKNENSWTAWYENGQKKSQGKYIAGFPVGEWIEWYANEKIKSKHNYTDSQSHKITWYETGEKHAENFYNKDGQKINLCTSWYKTGQKMAQEYYTTEGILEKEIYWDENGKVWSKKYYVNGILSQEINPK